MLEVDHIVMSVGAAHDESISTPRCHLGWHGPAPTQGRARGVGKLVCSQLCYGLLCFSSVSTTPSLSPCLPPGHHLVLVYLGCGCNGKGAKRLKNTIAHAQLLQDKHANFCSRARCPPSLRALALYDSVSQKVFVFHPCRVMFQPLIMFD